jgi:hypothetical protein
MSKKQGQIQCVIEENVHKESSLAEAMEAQLQIARKRSQGMRAEIRTGFEESMVFWVSRGKGAH